MALLRDPKPFRKLWISSSLPSMLSGRDFSSLSRSRANTKLRKDSRCKSKSLVRAVGRVAGKDSQALGFRRRTKAPFLSSEGSRISQVSGSRSKAFRKLPKPARRRCTSASAPRTLSGREGPSLAVDAAVLASFSSKARTTVRSCDSWASWPVASTLAACCEGGAEDKGGVAEDDDDDVPTEALEGRHGAHKGAATTMSPCIARFLPMKPVTGMNTSPLPSLPKSTTTKALSVWNAGTCNRPRTRLPAAKPSFTASSDQYSSNTGPPPAAAEGPDLAGNPIFEDEEELLA
mmetsp:Transcript_134706/g.336129  ORF Transcript_134706/g.336129 Transcript_134706/m.336129 type:complete len:290 (-) Transcript_134706:90-959(-)